MMGRSSSFVIAILSALILVFPGTVLAVAQDMNTDQINVDAPAAYVIDTGTNDVLYSKAAGTRRAIASTTKILTAMLVIESSRMDDIVTVSPYAARTGGAVIGLRAGEERRVEELLFVLMLASANDAAVALAEHVGGSEAEFAVIMNQKARELGAMDSRFTVPHGLAAGSDHYSTAFDMGRISQAAMKNETFRELVSTRRYTWEAIGGGVPRELQNSNVLLDRYAAAVGVKTGFTNESGYCLVAGAETPGRSVMAIILGSNSRERSFEDGQALLDWALKEFEYRRIVKRDRRYAVIKLEGKSVPLLADRTVEALVPLTGRSQLIFDPKIRPGIVLPLRRGERVGSLNIVHSGRRLERVNLMVGRSVRSSYAERNATGYLWRVVNKMINLF